jgi:hypothetical protein
MAQPAGELICRFLDLPAILREAWVVDETDANAGLRAIRIDIVGIRDRNAETNVVTEGTADLPCPEGIAADVNRHRPGRRGGNVGLVHVVLL